MQIRKRIKFTGGRRGGEAVDAVENPVKRGSPTKLKACYVVSRKGVLVMLNCIQND